jgi:hypothetical protein
MSFARTTERNEAAKRSKAKQPAEGDSSSAIEVDRSRKDAGLVAHGFGRGWQAGNLERVGARRAHTFA